MAGFVLGIVGFWYSLFQLEASQKAWVKFQNDVQDQIDDGMDAITAGAAASANAIRDDPDLKEARAILRDLSENLPDRMKADYDKLFNQAATNINDFKTSLSGIDAQYEQRITDVMGLLEGQGEQALKDIARTFGEAAGQVSASLAERGLAGSGVGASVAAGFATKEADALARSREATGLLKADALSGLTGEQLRAKQQGLGLAAGFEQQLFGNQAQALSQVYGVESNTGLGYANFLSGVAGQSLDDLNFWNARRVDFVEGINQVPPPVFDPSLMVQSALNIGGNRGTNFRGRETPVLANAFAA